MKTIEPPVIVEETFKSSQANVWLAITRPGRMVKWYFDNIPDFKPEVGFETAFNVQNEGRDFLHQWKVTEVIPNKKIAYNWTYKDYDGEAIVSFELSHDGKFTKLVLTNTVLKDFDDNIPEFRRESCVGGWEYFIKGRLKDYLKSPK